MEYVWAWNESVQQGYILNLSATAWSMSQQLACLSQSYYNVRILSIGTPAWNACLQLANLSQSLLITLA